MSGRWKAGLRTLPSSRSWHFRRQAEAFVADPAYAPYVAARQSGSESRFQLIDDTDVAGTISYLAKG